jgi:hypothetical protein
LQANAAFDTEAFYTAALPAQPAPPSCKFAMLSQVDPLSMLPHIVCSMRVSHRVAVVLEKWQHRVACRIAGLFEPPMILCCQAAVAVTEKWYFLNSHGCLKQHDMEQHGNTCGHA